MAETTTLTGEPVYKGSTLPENSSSPNTAPGRRILQLCVLREKISI